MASWAQLVAMDGERSSGDEGRWGQRKREGDVEPDDLLCSRTAHARKVLVGRAQWEINQPPSLRENERAWKEQYLECSFDARNGSNHPPPSRLI